MDTSEVCGRARALAVVLVLGALVPGVARGQSDLAKASQNPVANMISVPIQENVLFGIGLDDQTASVTNLQPVIPLPLGPVNLINRVILPLIYVPDLTGGIPDLPLGLPTGGTFGLGDLSYTAFFSPAEPGALIWGLGPAFVFPTATSAVLGTGKYSLGPSVVVLTMPGPWVIGVLVRQVWSFAGDDTRRAVSQLLLQYFVTLNLPRGWFVTSAPVMTANWEAARGQRWNVPVGLGFGRTLPLAKGVGISASIQGFYHVEHPVFGPSWSTRVSLAFLFATGD